MNENMKKLIAALRSGEYNQTTHVLRDEYGFCCLGVACDLYIKEHDDTQWIERSGERGNFYIINKVDGDREQACLPPQVSEWLGLGNAEDIMLNPDNDPSARTAIGLNDDGESFSAIADAIEAYYATK